jgi:hypothetical protein
MLLYGKRCKKEALWNAMSAKEVKNGEKVIVGENHSRIRHTIGGYIHFLLVIAIVVVLNRIIQGRRPL